MSANQKNAEGDKDRDSDDYDNDYDNFAPPPQTQQGGNHSGQQQGISVVFIFGIWYRTVCNIKYTDYFCSG